MSADDHKFASSQGSHAQPFLHFGDIRIVIKAIGRSRRAKRMGVDF